MSQKEQSHTSTAAPSGTLEAVKLDAVPPTRAERLRALEQEFGATSTRAVHPKSKEVLLGLEFENGDRVVGRGIDTEAALTNLEVRVAQFRQEG